MKTLKIPGTIIILVLLLSAACKKPQATLETDIEVPVSVMEVDTASIEEFINTTGNVYAVKEVILKSEMAGKYHLQINPLTGKPFALGDRVKEGVVLIKIEDEEYYNNLRIKSKEVDLEISQQEYEKQQSLYDKGGATLRELKNAEINLINTKYDIESSRINLQKMVIEAPFNGVISSLPYYTNGARLNTGTELVTVIDYSALYLEARLPEKYYGNISKGFKVYVSSYTNPGDTLMGRITQIAPAIDPEARTFTCYVEVENSDLILLPGTFVKADMVVNSSINALVIPKDIILSQNRREMVYVVDKGIAKIRQITTGLENDTQVEVTSGLLAGESVVINGFETLRNDSKVRIVQ
jgi:RND family efflux transporter MFP subunit